MVLGEPVPRRRREEKRLLRVPRTELLAHGETNEGVGIGITQETRVKLPLFRQAPSAIPGLNRGDIYAQSLPIAPLAEQCRIVAAIEALLTRLGVAREQLGKLQGILKRFRQAVLAAACSGRLTADWQVQQNGLESGANLAQRIGTARRQRYAELSNLTNQAGKYRPREFNNYEPALRDDLVLFELPAQWKWVDLRFLMDPEKPFCYGVVQPGEDQQAGVFLIRAGDLKNGTVNTSGLRKIPKGVDAEFSRSKVEGGELLITVVGAGIGSVSVVPGGCAGFNIARAVAKVPIRDFSTRYVFWWLNSAEAVGWMKGDSREVARPTLNLEQLQTLPVPLPPLAEQHEIVRRVEALFRLADHIEKRVVAATARADKLTQAILAKAFRGELVPTEAELARREGRDYELASALLERIRAERAKEGNGAKRAKRGGQRPKKDD